MQSSRSTNFVAIALYPFFINFIITMGYLVGRLETVACYFLFNVYDSPLVCFYLLHVYLYTPSLLCSYHFLTVFKVIVSRKIHLLAYTMRILKH